MRRKPLALLLPVAVLLTASCSALPPSLSLRFRSEVRAPSEGPKVRSVAPRLVSCKGFDVSYVANADGEVYWHRGVYYTFFDGDWFYSRALHGPWHFIQMKFVHRDLFGARGVHPFARR